MILLKSILVEMAERNKTLHIYDFDDTLAKTNVPVYVVGGPEGRKKLTSHEFATYRLKPGESFDFSEFDKMIAGGKTIEKYIDELVNSILKSQRNPNMLQATILTARSVGYPVSKWLESQIEKKYKLNIRPYVVAVGGSNPDLKADYIEKKVTDSGYRNIKFVDDSEANLKAVGMRLKKYPSVQTVLIDPKTDRVVKV